jgi:saccharopine dehydrogenase (NADP+, L-glutamate forming)
VQLGLTDDHHLISDSASLTLPKLMDRYLPAGNETVQEKLIKFLPAISPAVIDAFAWLGAFSGTETLGKTNLSSADALLHFLQVKWVLAPQDKDMIVMQHQFDYQLADGKKGKRFSSLVVKGKDQTHTAMAQTVGLPLGIACRLVMEDKVNDAGVIVPVSAKWYEPILAELSLHGINFVETEG